VVSNGLGLCEEGIQLLLRHCIVRCRYGKDRAKFLESVIVADVQELAANDSKLTLVTNAKGGIIDDSVITNHGPYV
jgi:hypothetical protein